MLNEQAVFSCMVYVDYNPIRAGILDALDESEFTSIQQRINEYSQQQKTKGAIKSDSMSSTPLATFTESEHSQ